MKISIINKLVIGALVATIVTGCGGSGTGVASASFKSGIYVPVNPTTSVKFLNDMSGSGEVEIPLLAGYHPQAICMSSNKMYTSAGDALLCYDSPSSSPTTFTFPKVGVNYTNITQIATDSTGRIYINDYSSQRVVRIDNMSGANLTVLNYAPYMDSVSDDNLALAVDSQDRIYIAPRGTCKVIRFNTMADSAPLKFGSFGHGTNQFYSIHDLAFDSTNRLYIVDRYNDRIVRIDDMSGTNWAAFGTNGSGANQFANPCHVAIGPDNSIYVGDPNNNRIERFTDMSGANWSTFGSAGTGVGKFPEISGLAVR